MLRKLTIALAATITIGAASVSNGTQANARGGDAQGVSRSNHFGAGSHVRRVRAGFTRGGSVRLHHSPGWDGRYAWDDGWRRYGDLWSEVPATLGWGYTDACNYWSMDAWPCFFYYDY